MTQLLFALDDWIETLNSGNSVHVLTLSLMKGCTKRFMHNYGFRGDLFNWIQDFLKGHRQRVSVNGSLSGWSDVISGISQ